MEHPEYLTFEGLTAMAAGYQAQAKEAHENALRAEGAVIAITHLRDQCFPVPIEDLIQQES